MSKNRTIFVIFGGFFLLSCILIPLFALIVSLPPEHSVRRVVVTTFWLCGFVGLPLFVVAGLGWTLWDNWQSRQVARHLAGVLGLEPLHNAPNLMQQWYGGWLHGRAFGLKPVVFLSRSYDGAHHRSSFQATFYLRMALAVNIPQPLNVTVERTHNDHSATTSLSTAFPTLEHGERLPHRAQDALLHFVQQGDRNLRLLDRAAVPDALMPPEILTDAIIVLIHDQARPRSMTPTALEVLLNELSMVAAGLEEADPKGELG
ncbi:hypothetical protein [Candidatus Chloroploca sp. Khr17]|uniref:hypothetical protein n=1 Tax=Candidatus Chloroploca sp. Khr17 TaxID=2496869 RepID=UPI00101D22A5|nr:hypothetical protein [Candidatus Chloroploca sp. Khr17]